MAVRRILLLGDPALYRRSEPVVDPKAEQIAELVADLRDTLLDFRGHHHFGRGIAAPQVGIHRRVIYIDTGDGEFCGPLFNPAITEYSEEKMTYWDGCFSFPDLLVEVTRSSRVSVAYQDAEGTARTLATDGDLAELLQHEIDHLDGILATDRVETSRHICVREEWKRQFHSFG